MEELYNKNGILLYWNSDDYILELWGSSTKHCDSKFRFRDFRKAHWVDEADPVQVRSQIFQWLLECASHLEYPPHAETLAKYALENWCVWNG